MSAVKENPAEFLEKMVYAIKNNDYEKVRDGFHKFDKYKKQLLKKTFTIEEKHNSTLLHYALRVKASNKILDFLTNYPYDENAKSEEQTYYDIAVETKNPFAVWLFLNLDQKMHIINDIVPEAKHAIENHKPETLDELLEKHIPLIDREFLYKDKTILEYALNHGTYKDIIDIIIKYYKLYGKEYNTEYYYQIAVEQNANNDIVKLFEPAYILNENVLTKLKKPVVEEPALPVVFKRYLSNYDIEVEDGLHIITLLKGTLLFNAFRIMTPAERSKEGTFYEFHNANNMYLQLLNGILPLSTNITTTDTHVKIESCIDKNATKFFYANPAGGPALGDVNGTFNTLVAFELKEDIRVAVLMSPSPQHRIEGKEHSAVNKCKYYGDTYKKKKAGPGAYCRCSYHNNIGCPYAAPYDVCISPAFMKEHNIHGHIAIAETDSYIHKMREFDQSFADSPLMPAKYKKLNYKLFEACVSLDKRMNYSAYENNSQTDVIGFPEIVLQIYGTQWYEQDLHEQRFSVELPIVESPENTIINYLLTVDTSHIFKNASNPLSIKYISTSRAFYNLETGSMFYNPLYKHSVYNEINSKYSMFYYLNYLEAYLRNELQFFIDPRTGFLMNAGTNLDFIVNNNKSTKKYKHIKLIDYINESFDNGSLFDKSFKLRKGWIPMLYKTLLYPHRFMPALLYNSNNALANSSNSNSSKSNSSKSNNSKAQSGGGPLQKTRKQFSGRNSKIHHTIHKTLKSVMKSYSRRPLVEKKLGYGLETPLWVDNFYKALMVHIRKMKQQPH